MGRPSDPHAKIKLLAAAEVVFVARGLDAAKVAEITDRAHLAKGSFYLHFASKEDAFRQLVEAMLGRLHAYLEAAPEDCGHSNQDLRVFLDQWVRQDVQIFEFIWQNRGLMGLLLEGGKSATFRYLVDEFAEQARLKMRNILQRCVHAGIYRKDLDLDLTSAFIAGAYDRLARQIVRAAERPDLEATLREVQFLVLRGIASVPMLAVLDTLQTPEAPIPTPSKKTRRRRAGTRAGTPVATPRQRARA